MPAAQLKPSGCSALACRAMGQQDVSPVSGTRLCCACELCLARAPFSEALRHAQSSDSIYRPCLFKITLTEKNERVMWLTVEVEKTSLNAFLNIMFVARWTLI